MSIAEDDLVAVLQDKGRHARECFALWRDHPHSGLKQSLRDLVMRLRGAFEVAHALGVENDKAQLMALTMLEHYMYQPGRDQAYRDKALVLVLAAFPPESESRS